MDKEQIFTFMNENSSAMVATSDKNIPSLRLIWTVQSDENGVLFHTGKIKNFHRQLLENPNVEICFFNSDKSVQIRVSGIVRMLDNDVLKLALMEKRPFLKEIEQKTGTRDFFSLFLLEKCRALVWTFATNLAPKEYVELCSCVSAYH